MWHLIMSVEIYFINETKKQVLSTKKLYGDFEDKQQLLCYINLCQGDLIRIEFESCKWIDDFLYNKMHIEYKKIILCEFKISVTDDLYESKEYDRLYEVVNTT